MMTLNDRVRNTKQLADELTEFQVTISAFEWLQQNDLLDKGVDIVDLAKECTWGVSKENEAKHDTHVIEMMSRIDDLIHNRTMAQG